MHVSFPERPGGTPPWPGPPELPPPASPWPGGAVPPPIGPDLGSELRARLFEQRTVLLSGRLDDPTASRLVAELMTLDATGDTPVQLQLDCSGGSLDAAFAVIDTIDLCGVDVRVTCLGRAEGVAVGVLAAGRRRAAAEHAVIRLADPEIVVEGRAADVAAHAAAAAARVLALHERVAQAVRRPVAEVAEDFRAGRYLTAEEALAYRLIDEVAGREAAIRLLAARRLGFRPPGRR